MITPYKNSIMPFITIGAPSKQYYIRLPICLTRLIVGITTRHPKMITMIPMTYRILPIQDVPLGTILLSSDSA